MASGVVTLVVGALVLAVWLSLQPVARPMPVPLATLRTALHAGLLWSTTGDCHIYLGGQPVIDCEGRLSEQPAQMTIDGSWTSAWGPLDSTSTSSMLTITDAASTMDFDISGTTASTEIFRITPEGFLVVRETGQRFDLRKIVAALDEGG